MILVYDRYRSKRALQWPERIIIKSIRLFIKITCTNGVLGDLYQLVVIGIDLCFLSSYPISITVQGFIMCYNVLDMTHLGKFLSG